jgi:protein-tyrosine kinase
MSRIYTLLEQAERERGSNGTDRAADRARERSGSPATAAPPPRVDIEYQKLRAALHALAASVRARGIVVCSAAHGEGTSRIASALARSCAQSSGTSVLLVDANVRNPRAHRVFGIRRAPGLTDVLLSAVAVEEAIVPTSTRGLLVLPAGRAQADPLNLFEAARLEALLGTLGADHEYVLIDTGPVNTSPETAILARTAGAVVLVVQAERTRIDVIKAASEQLTSRGANVCGVVLNRRKYYIPRAIYRRL